MIETAEGVKNANEIASVPGVGAIFVGAFGDLPNSMGLPESAPEVEGASIDPESLLGSQRRVRVSRARRAGRTETREGRMEDPRPRRCRDRTDGRDGRARAHRTRHREVSWSWERRHRDPSDAGSALF